MSTLHRLWRALQRAYLNWRIRLAEEDAAEYRTWPRPPAWLIDGAEAAAEAWRVRVALLEDRRA
jgi:hypothetical protein